MTETEVTVTYRSQSALITAILLAPVTAFVFLFVIWSFFVTLLGAASNAYSIETALCLLACQVFSLAALIFWLRACLDNRILLSRDGLSCSIALTRALKPHLRIEHPWNSLETVSLLSGMGGKSRQKLLFIFETGSPLGINLELLKEEEIQQILLALEVWAPHVRETSNFDRVKREILSLSADPAVPGYTEMWEEELTRRFGSTNFIPLEPETVVGNQRFRVVRQLAFGGFSAIYLVIDSNNERFVLKESVVPADFDSGQLEKARELFAREAEVLSKLSHPGIAKVYDHFVEGERNYLILSYERGQDLRRFIKENGPQPEGKVVELSSQIAQILSYLHCQSPPVIHRDLSPDNLILKEDGKVTVIDFGAANEFIGTATGTMVGKQRYMAPEQLRGKAVPQSDIYSTGCTMFFLLTGEDPEALCVSTPREKNPSVSEEMNELVASCTRLSIDQRLSSACKLESRLSLAEQ